MESLTFFCDARLAHHFLTFLRKPPAIIINLLCQCEYDLQHGEEDAPLTNIVELEMSVPSD